MFVYLHYKNKKQMKNTPLHTIAPLGRGRENKHVTDVSHVAYCPTGRHSDTTVMNAMQEIE